MSSPSSAARQSSALIAAARIRDAIVEGRLPAGSRLKEDVLAQELDISRTPIREALRTLEAEGLVILESMRGAAVRSYSAQELDDLYSLRALLEGYVARRAAINITEEQLEIVEKSAARFLRLSKRRKGVEPRELVQENMLFHGTILEASAHPRLTGMVRNLIQLPLVYKAYIWYSHEQTVLSGHYHSQLARVLRRGDAERAELLMRDHVLEARDFLVEKVRSEGDGDAD